MIACSNGERQRSMRSAVSSWNFERVSDSSRCSGPSGRGGDERQVDLGLLDLAELDLRLLGRLLQALRGHAVGGEVDAVRGLELLDEPVDDPLVPVVAAELGVAVGALHLEHAVADLEHAHVERAAAEVEHEDGLVLGALLEAVGEGGRGGLVDDPQHLEAGDLAGFLGGGALRVVEVRGHGDDGLVDAVAEERLGVALQLHQDAGADLLRRVLLAVDVARLPALAHLRLDAAEGAIGVGDRLALGDLADEDLAGLAEGDDRRRGALPLGVGDDDRVTRLEDRDDRVGGAEVDSDCSCHGVGAPCVLVGMWGELPQSYARRQAWTTCPNRKLERSSTQHPCQVGIHGQSAPATVSGRRLGDTASSGRRVRPGCRDDRAPRSPDRDDPAPRNPPSGSERQATSPRRGRRGRARRRPSTCDPAGARTVHWARTRSGVPSLRRPPESRKLRRPCELAEPLAVDDPGQRRRAVGQLERGGQRPDEVVLRRSRGDLGRQPARVGDARLDPPHRSPSPERVDPACARSRAAATRAPGGPRSGHAARPPPRARGRARWSRPGTGRRRRSRRVRAAGGRTGATGTSTRRAGRSTSRSRAPPPSSARRTRCGCSRGGRSRRTRRPRTRSSTSTRRGARTSSRRRRRSSCRTCPT